jgi:hypothetical protein
MLLHYYPPLKERGINKGRLNRNLVKDLCGRDRRASEIEYLFSGTAAETQEVTTP